MISTLLALAFVGAASADELEAETCLRAKVWDGYAEGWGIRTMTTSALQNGQTKNYLVTLYKGNEYQIRTCADANVKNLDVYLYDLNGNVVKRDETTDREPWFGYTPTDTGTYYVVLHARELVAATTPAGVAMAVTYK